DGTSRTVDNYILGLRHKLERDPAHPRHLKTVRQVGYVLET
ncbi:MAG: DNA-binding response regulator, partial [Deltaproteobacteria bacterium]